MDQTKREALKTAVTKAIEAARAVATARTEEATRTARQTAVRKAKEAARAVAQFQTLVGATANETRYKHSAGSPIRFSHCQCASSTSTGSEMAAVGEAAKSSTSLAREGNIEVEVLAEGMEASAKWLTCKKNPGHKDFIPVSEFSMKHLPQAYRNNLYLKGIRAIAALTVKLCVKYISNDRPESDCLSRFRGKKLPRVGTGLVDEFLYSLENLYNHPVLFTKVDLHTRDSESNDAFEDDTGGYDYHGPADKKVSRSHGTEEKYDDISAYQCLEKIKSLRASLRLKGTDQNHSSVNEDEDTADEDEELMNSERMVHSDDVSWVNDYMNDTCSTVEPCPCPECNKCVKGSGERQPIGYYVNILTARHVVFDIEEAENTVAELFYDDENSNIKKMYGLRSFIVSQSGDSALIMCVTHDQSLVRKLHSYMAPMVRRVQLMKKFSTEPLVAICSHPHGHFKHISLGPWTSRKLSPRGKRGTRTSYFYEAPTCPGSSGASVLVLGCRPRTRVMESDFHPHHGDTSTVGVNESGRAFSTDRPLSELPDSVVVKVLKEYEDIVRKENQKIKEKENDKQPVKSKGTERLQDYIRYLQCKIRK